MVPSVRAQSIVEPLQIDSISRGVDRVLQSSTSTPSDSARDKLFNSLKSREKTCNGFGGHVYLRLAPVEERKRGREGRVILHFKEGVVRKKKKKKS